jgi:hypothetical protein
MPNWAPMDWAPKASSMRTMPTVPVLLAPFWKPATNRFVPSQATAEPDCPSSNPH